MTAELPVARVAVMSSLAHLDRPFDYAVAPKDDVGAVPGARVRVRLAGRDVEGFVLERVARSEHGGELQPLRRVVSPLPVLTAAVARLCREVADRYGGTMADVVRLAVPPRAAAADRRAPRPSAAAPPSPAAGPWAAYPAGPALLARLEAGESPGAAWTAAPGEDWPLALATAAVAVASTGRGALLVLPDGRDVDRVLSACEGLAPGCGLDLRADVGTHARWTAFLRVLTGEVRVVVGTRGAAFAPVRDLGLVAVWDDGDDLHDEPRQPGPHTREVARLRAHGEGAALVLGATSRSTETQEMVEAGAVREVVLGRAAVRARAPRVVVTGDASGSRDAAAATARVPSAAWRVAHDALARGPVLIQVPRRGYVPALTCQRCRAPARCRHCHGPLALHGSGGVPACRWCARPDGAWECGSCRGRRLRSGRVGHERTAEEFGRAFPGVPVRRSGAGDVLATVDPTPSLVVSTPGAEPVVEGGYAAALLLDSWSSLERTDLRAGEEALRRWLAAATLVRPARDGGAVAVVGEAGYRPVQALVRWHPVWAAEAELQERRSLGLQPAASVAVLSGDAGAVDAVLGVLAGLDGARVLGPAPREHSTGPPGPEVQAVVAVSRARRSDLAGAVHAALSQRSARKSGGRVRVRVDPHDLR